MLNESEVFCERTIKGSTMTADGLIPHKLSHDGILMPVKLQIRKSADIAGLHPAMRDKDGNLVYALPGGLSFIDYSSANKQSNIGVW